MFDGRTDRKGWR